MHTEYKSIIVSNIGTSRTSHERHRSIDHDIIISNKGILRSDGTHIIEFMAEFNKNTTETINIF